VKKIWTLDHLTLLSILENSITNLVTKSEVSKHDQEKDAIVIKDEAGPDSTFKLRASHIKSSDLESPEK